MSFFFMQKRLFSTTPVGVGASPLPSSSFTVEYLVRSCGVPLKSAISIAASPSHRFHLKEEKTQRYDSVLDLFRSHGFDHTHIGAVLEKTPLLLIDYKVDENLRPKFEYLALNCFSASHLLDLIVSKPYILKSSLSTSIKPSLEFLRSLLGTEERVYLAVKRHPRLIRNDLKGAMQPNIDLLVKGGVDLDDIIKVLMRQASFMLLSGDRLAYALQTVKARLAMHPSSPQFLVAVGMIASSGGLLLEKKIQVFESFGFSQEKVLCIFRRYPCCISRSENTLRTKLEFYLHTVKLKQDGLISYPHMLAFAIETRSRPRHNVLKLLLSKKLLKENAKLARIFTISEGEFLNKYIKKYVQQVPSLLETYANDKNRKKIHI